MEILVDDSSPQISFLSARGGWSNDHSQDGKNPDPYAKLYKGGTFHATNLEGDKMVFRFNGTGIALYGARRPNHQVCGVTIDNEAEVYISGYAQTPEFQRLLFGKSDLKANQEHVITVTNYPSKQASNSDSSEISSTTDRWLDIDHLVITQALTGALYTTYLDDTSSSFRFENGWKSTSTADGEGNSYKSTVHTSSVSGAGMSLSFNGTSIQLYGTVGPSYGNYSIILDDGLEQRYNATNWETLDRVALFTSSGLKESVHTLQLVNRAINSTSSHLINIDYAVVNSTISPVTQQGVTVYTTTLSPPPQDTATATSQSTSQSTDISGSTGDTNSGSDSSSDHPDDSDSDQNSGSNVGVIAGSVVSVVLTTFLVMFLLWYIQRRRSQRHNKPKILRVKFPPPSPSPTGSRSTSMRSRPPTLPAKELPKRYDYYQHQANVDISLRSKNETDPPSLTNDSASTAGSMSGEDQRTSAKAASAPVPVPVHVPVAIPTTTTGSKFHEMGMEPTTASSSSASWKSGSSSGSISAPLMIISAVKPVPPSPAAVVDTGTPSSATGSAEPGGSGTISGSAASPEDRLFLLRQSQPRPRPPRPTPRPLQNDLLSMTSSLSEWIYENGGGSVTSTSFSFLMSPAASSCHPEDACQPSPATSDSSALAPSPFKRHHGQGFGGNGAESAISASAPMSNTPIFDRFSASLRSSLRPPPLVTTRDRHKFNPGGLSHSTSNSSSGSGSKSNIGRSHPFANFSSPTREPTVPLPRTHSQSDDETHPRGGPKRNSRLKSKLGYGKGAGRGGAKKFGNPSGLVTASKGKAGERTSTKSTPPPSWARHKKLQLGAAENESGTM